MTKHEACLYDFGLYLKERAVEAVSEWKKTPKNSTSFPFLDGRCMAFYEVISMLQQTAAGLGIPLEELRLEDVVPDRDLT